MNYRYTTDGKRLTVDIVDPAGKIVFTASSTCLMRLSSMVGEFWQELAASQSVRDHLES